MPMKAVRLSIAQMELQTEPAPMTKPELQPKRKVRPEEEADVALEKAVEKVEPIPKPQPEPIPDVEVPVAHVNQEASAPQMVSNPDDVQGWLLEKIEKEKYYPLSAQRLGLKGKFDLKIMIDETGTIQSAEVLGGEGHQLLRQAVEKILSKITGLKYSKPIGEPMGFEVEFEFE